MPQTAEQRARSALYDFHTAGRLDALARAQQLVRELDPAHSSDAVLGLNLARGVIASDQLWRGQYDAPLALAQCMEEAASLHALPELAARALHILGWRERALGRLSTASRLLEESQFYAGRAGDEGLVDGIVLERAEVLLTLHGFGAADSLLRSVEASIHASRYDRFLHDWYNLRAQAALGLGDVQQADKHHRDSLAYVGPFSQEESQIYAASVEARIARRRGHPKPLEFLQRYYDRSIAAGYQDASGSLLAHIVWAHIEALDDPASAIDAWESAPDWPIDRADSHQWVALQLSLADCYVALGEPRRASSTLEDVLEHLGAQRDVNMGEVRSVLKLGDDLVRKHQEHAENDAKRALLDDVLGHLQRVNGSLQGSLSVAMSELRDPLSELQRFTDALSHAAPEPRRGRASAESATEKMLEVIAVLDRAVPRSVSQPVPLRPILNDALPVLRRSADRVGRIVHLKIDPDVRCPVHVSLIQRIVTFGMNRAISEPDSVGPITIYARDEEASCVIEFSFELAGIDHAASSVEHREPVTNTGELIGLQEHDLVAELIKASGGTLRTTRDRPSGTIRLTWPLTEWHSPSATTSEPAKRTSDNESSARDFVAEARAALEGFYGSHRERSLRDAQELLTHVGNAEQGPEMLAANIARCVVATEHIMRCRYDQAQALANRIVGDGQLADLPELSARGTRLLAQCKRFQGHSSAGIRLGGEALDYAILSVDEALVTAITLDMAAGLVELDGFAQAVPLLEQLKVAAEAPELARLRVHVHMYYAVALLGLERYEEALFEVNRSLASPVASQRSEHLLHAVALRARILRHLGRHESELYLSEALEKSRRSSFREPEGVIRLERGFRRLQVDKDYAAAAEDFEQAILPLNEPYFLAVKVEAIRALAEARRRLDNESGAHAALREAIAVACVERDHHLAEIRGVVALDADLMAKGRTTAAEHARKVLVEQMAGQFRRANRDMSSKLSEAMHDIRSPLMVLQWITSSMISIDRPSEAARAATQHISDIVAQLETGLGEEEAEHSCVQEVLAEVLALYNQYAAKKGSQVSLHCSGFSYVRATKSAIRRLAFNIVENALKFSPPGSEIRIHVEDQEDHVVLQVFDQGPGFAKGLVARPTAGERSTGLGLGIVRSLLASCDAVIAMQDYEEGGCVEIRWPTSDPSGG